jgi:predicted metal-dependent hydrolase
MSQSTAPTEDRKIPTRRITFDETLQDLPRHFAAEEDLVLSHVIAVLSSVFPDGEDFFVRSVRHYRDRITEPEFKRQVAGFIGQEAIHGREHRALNARLAELGYPTKRIERGTRFALGLRSKHLSPISNLALTAALEHFTATLAEVLLGSAEARESIAHEGVRNLLVWHALEESEHKAVAFDVYRAVGGTERRRINTMRFIRAAFISGTTLQALTSLAADRAAWRRGALRESLRRVRSSPFLQRAVWDQLREYDRPGFHPDDRDTHELVTQWRAELFGTDGALVDRLVGSAA